MRRMPAVSARSVSLREDITALLPRFQQTDPLYADDTCTFCTEFASNVNPLFDPRDVARLPRMDG